MKTVLLKFVLISVLLQTLYVSYLSAQRINSKKLNRDYIPVLYPNTSDVVGKIYSKDKNGRIRRITEIEVKTDSSDIVIGEYTKTRSFTWGVILNFLGIKNSSVSGDANLKGTSDILNKISYRDTKQYYMDALKADSLIKQKRVELHKFAKEHDLGKMEFFLIIEHITAKQVDYGLTRSASTNDSINIKLSEIGSISPSITYNKSSNYQIHYKLPTGLTVLYSTLPLKPPPGQLSGDDFMLEVASYKRVLIDISTIHE